MACFAYKWKGDRRTKFVSEWDDGQEGLAGALHSLLNEADLLVHFNGISFDTKWARTTMITNGYTRPPSPWKDVDLYLQSLKFRLPSHKLEYVSTRLIPTPGKLSTGGFALWKAVYFGDEAAQRKMRRYNLQDVDVMEPIFDEMFPWMTGIPSVALYDSTVTERDENGRIVYLPPACRCGSTNLEKRGFRFTAQSKFQRYQCQDCGSWLTDTRAIARIQMAEAR